MERAILVEVEGMLFLLEAVDSVLCMLEVRRACSGGGDVVHLILILWTAVRST